MSDVNSPNLTNPPDLITAKSNSKSFKFTLPELIFIALMSAANVGFDLVVSPGLKLLMSHVVAGIFIMVPVNFVFMSITRLIVKRYGTITLYLVIFGILSIPTTLFGNAPGIYKVVVGLGIGLILDLTYLPSKISLKLLLVAFFGSVFWWVITFSVWQGFGFPYVTAFSNLLNAASNLYNGSLDLSSFVKLPITGFGIDFFLFASMCGLLSAVPVFIGCIMGYSIVKKIEKTAIFIKFQQIQ